MEYELLRPQDFRFRKGTLDRNIYDNIITGNEYRLPPAFSRDDVVIDIGAHIGAFSLAVIERGCRNVIAIEADADNHELAKRNLQQYIEQGWLTLLHAAAWRSDHEISSIAISGYPMREDIVNTGGARVGVSASGKSAHVPVTALDRILEEYLPPDHIAKTYMKLDCEGAEWPILYTSHKLHLVDAICGEYHESAGENIVLTSPWRSRHDTNFVIHDLLRHLELQGFTCHSEINTETPGLGLFWAARPRTTG